MTSSLELLLQTCELLANSSNRELLEGFEYMNVLGRGRVTRSACCCEDALLSLCGEWGERDERRF